MSFGVRAGNPRVRLGGSKLGGRGNEWRGIVTRDPPV